MRSFQKREKWKHVMQSKIFLMFLGVIILFFFFNMFSFLTKMEETKKNREIAETKVAELRKSREKFSLEIGKLNTERGVEEVIRENYSVAKEGENIIIITEDKSMTEANEEQGSSGFLSFFKNWFK